MSVIRGTVQELIKQGLKVNGEVVNQAEFSVLQRVGKGTFATPVGHAPRPEGARGKPATVWELNPQAQMNITLG